MSICSTGNSIHAESGLGAFFDSEHFSHRFNGKTPVEDIILTMKELVEYDLHLRYPRFITLILEVLGKPNI